MADGAELIDPISVKWSKGTASATASRSETIVSKEYASTSRSDNPVPRVSNLMNWWRLANRSYQARIGARRHSIWIWGGGCPASMIASPCPIDQYAMLTPSAVVQYWIGGSMVAPSYHRRRGQHPRIGQPSGLRATCSIQRCRAMIWTRGAGPRHHLVPGTESRVEFPTFTAPRKRPGDRAGS